VQLRIESGVTPGIVNLVERGACELGFVLMPLRNPRLEVRPVLHYRHVAVYPADGAPGTETTVSALCAQPLVLLTRDSATRRSFDEIVAAKGFQPHRILEVGSVSVQKAMVRAGLGAGILPDYALEPGDGLDCLPIQGSHEKTLALCRLKARSPSGPAKVLLGLLGEGGSVPEIHL
jgi:DNA-binding transcriptional LysR family regulator